VKNATHGMAGQAEAVGQLIGRVLLGVVLLYFGTAELLNPHQWVGYVPVGFPHFLPLVWLILVHGWVLFVLGAFVLLGIHTRLSALAAAAVLLTIVMTLFVQGGVTSILIRDLGLLGLALMIGLSRPNPYALDSLEPRGRPAQRTRAER
jgi:uncharacterized membrane protein YphA (DoxX/SURF4 family)